jgi:iron(III) transport system ATP-binding protein
MHRGRLEQWDDAYTLYHRPATRFVAQFIGHGVFTPARIDPTRATAACTPCWARWKTCQECPLPEAYPGATATCCCAPTTSCTTTRAR